MRLSDLEERLGIQPQHYQLKDSRIPVVEPGLYNTLGRRLYDLYQRYELTSEDQREVESICFLLSAFVWERGQRSPSFWERLRRLWRP